MTLSKQLVNLIGLLVTVIVLVLGVVLIALPAYSQAQALDANTRTVTQTNSVYQAQVDALSIAEKNIDQTDASLATLREGIPALSDLDDVYEIVNGAAQGLDVRIESVTADAPAAFVARDAIDEEGNAVAAEPAPAPSPSASGDGAGADAAAPAPAAPAADDESPQQQVPVKIVIDLTQPFALPTADAPAPDAAPAADETIDPAAVRAAATERARKASAFVDALGVGPRLLSPVNIDYADGKLTLTVFAYLRVEDAQ